LRFGCAELRAQGTGSNIQSASSRRGGGGGGGGEETAKDFVAKQATPTGAKMVQNVILVFFRRRLSQRPAVEELESRNILKRKFKSL